MQGILEALDEVLQEQEVYNIERVVISSTIVTNALTEGRTDPVFLAVMTGPGMNVSKSFPVEPYYVSGYVDHRGKITARIDWQKHHGLLSKAKNKMAAVSGKFSVRNPENEYALAGELKDCGYEKIFLGSELSGELNFVRRTNSAYFAAAVYKTFKNFCRQVQDSLPLPSPDQYVQGQPQNRFLSDGYGYHRQCQRFAYGTNVQLSDSLQL